MTAADIDSADTGRGRKLIAVLWTLVGLLAVFGAVTIWAALQIRDRATVCGDYLADAGTVVDEFGDIAEELAAINADLASNAAERAAIEDKAEASGGVPPDEWEETTAEYFELLTQMGELLTDLDDLTLTEESPWPEMLANAGRLLERYDLDFDDTDAETAAKLGCTDAETARIKALSAKVDRINSNLGAGTL